MPTRQSRAKETKRLYIRPQKANSTSNISDLSEGMAPLILNIDTTLGIKRSIRDGFYVDYSVREYVQDVIKSKKLGIKSLKLISGATSQDLVIDVHAFIANAILEDDTEKIAIIAHVVYPNKENNKYDIRLFDKDLFYNINTTFGCNFSIVGVSSLTSKIEQIESTRTIVFNRFAHSIAVNINYNQPVPEVDKGVVATYPIFIASVNNSAKYNEEFAYPPEENNLGINICEMKVPKSSSGIKFITPVNCRYEILKIPNINLTIFAFDATVSAGRSIVNSDSSESWFKWLDPFYWWGTTNIKSTWFEYTGHVISIIDPVDPTTYKYIGFLSEEEYLLGAHISNSVPLLVSNKNIYRLVRDQSVPVFTYTIESMVEKLYPIGPGVMVGNILYIIGINGLFKVSVRDSLFNVEEVALKIANPIFLGIKNNIRSIEYVDSYYDAENAKVVFILNMNNQWLDRLYYHLGIPGQRTTTSQDNEDNLTGLNFQAKTIMLSVSVDTDEVNLHATSLRFKGKLANYGNNINKELTGYDVTNWRNPAFTRDLDYSVNKKLIDTTIHDKYSFIDEDFLVYMPAKHCNQDAGYPFYVIYGFNLVKAFQEAQSELKSATVKSIDIIFSSRIDIISDSKQENKISDNEKLSKKILYTIIEHEESIMDMSREMIVKEGLSNHIVEPVGSYRLINRLRIPVKEMLLSGTLYIAFQSEIFSTLISAYINYDTNMF